MKKLLALTGFVALLVLTACGGNSGDETVCTMEGPFGDSASFRLVSEDGEVTGATIETSIDVSDWDAEDIAEESEFFDSCSQSGNTLVCTEATTEFNGEDLDEVVEVMEAFMGASCD